ncbi:outer membrane lipoprotein-sorting protein [Chryseobacterium chendengshani]|uniref:outer membrane lipoprotein-sorting protein n=1 Tax=unclassified Chryseobacterium TaxID=2593645 RepID=UPI001C63CE0B|nr:MULTISPECIES: outer membrane lipoprotein-sorting protein [unclassified Chryseobacterium]MBW7674593.1 outer membrane lipoprotein-sorting protein [Chryseobacterium sp. LJ756]MBW8522615.1 outer membrane lipoprotein-sorting protein [Chryseobacterium sp. LJ668]QYK16152.1 outer membrane lipoprotein-sorting protein [Chryseobacterium sp. LJ668]
MKKLFLIFVLIFSQLSFAQTAKEIIDKNIELSGGLTSWKLLNSVLLQGKVILGVKDEYPIKIYQQRPNLTKTVLTINGKETAIEGYDGNKGYAMNYAANKLQVYGDYIPESFDNDFIDWENKGFEAKYLGKEKVGNIYCHKVELTKNVNKNYYFFDTKNFMLLKEIKKDETLNYSDFKKVGNLSMPFRIESSSSKKDGDFVILLNKVDINKVFPANVFKF